MKFPWNRFAALLACLLFVFSAGTVARAQDVPELDRLGSITITLRRGGSPVTGGDLLLYRVGEVAENDGNYFFRPGGDFAGCGESFDDLEASADMALRLLSFAEKNALTPLTTKEIPAGGQVTFDDLAVGLYLLVQQEAAPGYARLAPFLVSLPYMENGTYHYDLSANPKTDLEQEPEPTEPSPTTPSDPKLPQTGQLWWPVPVLLCAGLLLFTVGVALNRRKKQA